jgi:hypothetical protein
VRNRELRGVAHWIKPSTKGRPAMNTLTALCAALHEAQDKALYVEHNMNLAAAIYRLRRAINRHCS